MMVVRGSAPMSLSPRTSNVSYAADLLSRYAAHLERAGDFPAKRGEHGTGRHRDARTAIGCARGEERDEWRVLARSCFDSAGGVPGFSY
jgi:hypothetical protein